MLCTLTQMLWLRNSLFQRLLLVLLEWLLDWQCSKNTWHAAIRQCDKAVLWLPLMKMSTVAVISGIASLEWVRGEGTCRATRTSVISAHRLSSLRLKHNRADLQGWIVINEISSLIVTLPIGNISQKTGATAPKSKVKRCLKVNFVHCKYLACLDRRWVAGTSNSCWVWPSWGFLSVSGVQQGAQKCPTHGEHPLLRTKSLLCCWDLNFRLFNLISALNQFTLKGTLISSLSPILFLFLWEMISEKAVVLSKSRGFIYLTLPSFLPPKKKKIT